MMIIKMIAGQNLSIGDPVYIRNDEPEKVYIAESNARAFGYALSSVLKDEQVDVTMITRMSEEEDEYKPLQDPDDENEEVDEELALAELLKHGVLFANSFDVSRNGKAFGHTVTLAVNANDLFYWATSDCEQLRYNEIDSLYRSWLKDKRWGVSKWVCKKRKMRPQTPIERDMRRDGVWDDELESFPYRDPKECG